jgi:hypothetical protein
MAIRRMIVWVTSTLFGAVSVRITLWIFNTSTSPIPLTSTILIFLSFSSLSFIWLDYFLKTHYFAVEDWI